jgi:hypothetical protein
MHGTWKIFDAARALPLVANRETRVAQMATPRAALLKFPLARIRDETQRVEDRCALAPHPGA